MPHTIVNPAGLHDPVPSGYSHTAAIAAGSDLVLVAGQYGSSVTGAVASTDFTDQVRQTFQNLSIALAAHRLALGDIVQLRSYVVDHDLDKLAAITDAVKDSWSAGPPPHTVIGVASLATPDIAFELEAVAVRP